MNNKTYVWDPLLRIFHWTLVLAFTVAYFTGDEETPLHIYAGYTILGLLGFRLIWGFIGGHYARFRHFSFAPSAVFAYLRSLVGGKSTRDYVGHNPAGSWMAIILLISLVFTSVSGLLVYGEEGKGPLAQSTTMQIVPSGTNVKPHEQQALENVALENHLGEHEDDDEEHDGEEFWEEVHEFFANLTVFLIFFHVSGVLLSSRKHGQNLVRAMITGYKS